MSWDYENGLACYTDDSTNTLGQQGILETGKDYLVSISVSGRTNGKIRFNSFGTEDEIILDGVYQISGTAVIEDVSITALDLGGFAFDGCIDFIYIVEKPNVTIVKSCNGETVQTVSVDEMSVYKSNVKINVSWDLPDNEYYISVEQLGLVYNSQPFKVGEYPCSVLLTWNNDDNAYSIDYETLQQVNRLRVDAKLWHPKGTATKRDIFEFSNGSSKIVYAKRNIEFLLTISQQPVYVHEALAIAIDHDHFYIDGVEHIVVNDEYEPSWRKSSAYAPVELSVKNKTQNLINTNCV